MATQTSPNRPRHRQILLLLLVLVAFYVLIPQIGSFKDSLHLLRAADLAQLGLAILATALTYFAAAGTYCLLAFRPLNYARTLLMQVASMFVNRLLPAGIGGIGVNYAYLRKSRHSGAQAASVITVNNSLGLIGHSLVLAVLLALFHDRLPPLQVMHHSSHRLLLDLGVAALVAVALIAWHFRHRLALATEGFWHQLLTYRHRPLRLSGALATSVSLTLANIVSLWFCAQALQANLPFISIMLVFTLGIAIGTATPTPGGLGGVEAGLVAGLVAYHVPSGQALAIVLAYRLISYWLALAIGALAFAFASRQKYV